jgi:hypothetical protein
VEEVKMAVTNGNDFTSKSRLPLLKQAIRELGSRAIDHRTAVGKALTRWRTDLVNDLGGPEALSVQEAALVELAVKTKLMLDSVDAWLLKQPSLVNARKRALLPVVRERIQLADALARYLYALGLQRRAAPVKSLEAYIAEKYTRPDTPDNTTSDPTSNSRQPGETS